MEASIKRTALGKSPGIDGLPSELYKVLLGPRRKGEGGPKPAIVNKLIIVYNKIIMHGPFKEWTKGILMTIYKKKGDQTDLRNYRPLSIMNVDYKIFTDILMQRLVYALKEVIGVH